jgi:divalent metal cation (Fe/Co/Zn/Cd) transporter
MYFVSFIIVLAFMVVALCLFIAGLMRLYRGKRPSRGLISSGFITALVGIVVTALVFNIFTI